MSKKARQESAAARAAAVRAEAAAQERRRNVMVIVGVVVAIVLIIGGGFFIQSQRDTTGDSGAVPTGPTSTATTDGTAVAAVDTYGLGVGDPDAPVKVEIFEDFLCPYCEQYESSGRDQLRQDAADGKVFLVYRPIAFLNEYSARALNAFAVVLNTAGPEAALKFHDLLYENQPSESGAMPDDDWLIEKAVEAGATEEQVSDGIKNNEYKQWVVNGRDDASKRGVNATPTVFVNGKAIANATSIEDLLAQTQQQIEAGQ